MFTYTKHTELLLAPDAVKALAREAVKLARQSGIPEGDMGPLAAAVFERLYQHRAAEELNKEESTTGGT